MQLSELFSLQPEKDQSEATIRELAGTATNFYNNQFEKVLQKMIFTQYENIGRNDLPFDYIKGTLNGLQLVYDWFQLKKGIVNNKE